jgi:hypothetical protein
MATDPMTNYYRQFAAFTDKLVDDMTARQAPKPTMSVDEMCEIVDRGTKRIERLEAILDAIEEEFDPQIYPQEVRDDFDAPDDAEVSVNITMGLWRRISRALNERG